MSGAYRYKPKFVDIRVRPPGDEAAAFVDPQPPRCEHPGCRAPATAEAPKSRERLNERYHFCAPHAAEYNRGWNYFEGMSEGEVRSHLESSLTGDRPTWTFKAGSNRSREAASFASRLGGDNVRDAFGMFNRARRPEPPDAAAPAAGRKLGRLERAAFADMNLAEDADAAAIRARYAELLKRFHPDSNHGDRSAEEKLQRVIKAYRTLQNAKLTGK